jgi:peptidoglycan/LPS O-acetylase OafA/YrhL
MHVDKTQHHSDIREFSRPVLPVNSANLVFHYAQPKPGTTIATNSMPVTQNGLRSQPLTINTTGCPGSTEFPRRSFTQGNVHLSNAHANTMLSTAERPTGGQKRKKSGRILELDALRAISCLNLLLFHFTYVYQNKYGFQSPLGFAFPYGKYGVQLFFMLSGLVNAMTLLSKRKPGDFIAARCIRIFPSYWLMIVVNLVLFACLSMFHTSPTTTSTLANASTMPRLFGYDTMEPVTWTLQIEMLFYGFLMITLMTGWIDRPLRLMMIAVGISFASCIYFDWHFVHRPESVWNSRFTVVENLFFMRNLPLFAMGILLNEIRSGRGKIWKHSAGILVSALAFHAIDLRDHNPVATAMLFSLLALSAYGKIPILRFQPLLFVSTISYSLYLFHNNAGCALIAWLESMSLGPQVSVLMGTIFAITLGAVVTFWFERPITRTLNKLWSGLKTWHATKTKTLATESSLESSLNTLSTRTVGR